MSGSANCAVHFINSSIDNPYNLERRHRARDLFAMLSTTIVFRKEVQAKNTRPHDCLAEAMLRQ